MLIHKAVDLVNPRAVLGAERLSGAGRWRRHRRLMICPLISERVVLLHGQEHAVLPARFSNEHRLNQAGIQHLPKAVFGIGGVDLNHQ